jgi:peptidoglycan/LPS O-acetylase OafA/YrhL
MDTMIVRLIALLVIAILLGAQVWIARGLPYRRRSFGVAALAVLVFAGYIVAQSAGFVTSAAQTAFTGVSLTLLVIAVIFYFLSVKNGEMRAQVDKKLAKMREMARQRGEKTGTRRNS